MSTRKTGKSLPLLAAGLLLGGCAVSPVGEWVEPVSVRYVSAPVGERAPATWARPCNYPVTRRYLPPVPGGAPVRMLTAHTQYDPGVRVRPYFRPWSIQPVGERLYYRQPSVGGWIFNQWTGRWERPTPFEPVSPASPSQWW